MDKKTLKHLDLFSGYGGFTIPASKYGIETINFSEIDKYATAVLKYRFPSITNLGDITKIKGEDLPSVDIITGGSPCQDLSVAGKGAGLNGERSGLFFHFIRLIKEKQPTYFVWENVKGALSSQRGWDFARVQIEMEQAGYDVWWQVLNAKDFGVPQNRERIFAIGIRKGSGREILFEQGESGQDTIKNIGNVYPSGGENGQVLDPSGISKAIKSGETNTKGNGGIGSSNSPKIIVQTGHDGTNIYGTDGIATTLKALGGGQGAKTGLYAIYRGRPNMPYEKGKRTLKYERYDKECPALTQNCATGDQKNMVAVPNSNGNIHSLDANYWKGSNNPNKSRRSQILVSKKRRKEYSLQEQSPALTSHYRGFPDGDGRPAVVIPTQLGNSKNFGNSMGGDSAFTLGASNPNEIIEENKEPPIMVSSTQAHSTKMKNLSPTLPEAMGKGGGHIPMKLENMETRKSTPVAIPVLTPNRENKRQNGRRFKEDGEPSFTITGQDRHGVFNGVRIRRLTPVECERLMGLEDNWTAKGIIDGKEIDISDTQRYKMCGNGVVVNCVDYIYNLISKTL